jgi:hypothetical protein
MSGRGTSAPRAEGPEAERTPPVSLAPGTEQAGLALMMADLIGENLAHNPSRWKDFGRLEALISIEARDAEVAVTLEFRRGSLVVHSGIHGTPVLHIAADSEPLLKLALLEMTAGIPNLFTDVGRALLKSIVKRDVRISGALAHPVALIRLTRLISVVYAPVSPRE